MVESETTEWIELPNEECIRTLVEKKNQKKYSGIVES